jgi:2-polyprenyl-6-hydroxyphenyl methylase/3-demethylubiquinone-9 3-methyltransferase
MLREGEKRSMTPDPTALRIDNDLYDRLADGWWDENGFLHILKTAANPWRLPYFQRIISQLAIDPKKGRALDVGCGGGLLAEEFAALGFAVTGLDPSDRSLEAARAHAAQNGLAIDYRTGYGDRLPFENESFEVVYCCDVLEHIRDWDAVIGEIARVLKRGGAFLYDTINRTAFSKIVVVKVMQEWSLTSFAPPKLHSWEMFIKPDELKGSLERHGLRSQDLRGMSLDVNPVQILVAARQFKTGKISGTELGNRIGAKEGTNLALSYMGYALK